MTGMQVQDGATLGDYLVVPPIVLGLSYATNASAVKATSTGPTAFYTNADLMGLAGPVYSNNFNINVLYSDEKVICDASPPPAVYQKVSATATGAGVKPPDYVIGFDSLQLVVDTSKVVQTSSAGSVILHAGAQPGETFKIFVDTMCCNEFNFSAIDNLWLTGTPVTTGTIMGNGDVTIPWTSFGLLGKVLPQDRNLIVQHKDGGSVYSYEFFFLRFPGPVQP